MNHLMGKNCIIDFGMEEMDMVECGLIYDMMTESGNDGEDYPIQAGKKEFREFLGG